MQPFRLDPHRNVGAEIRGLLVAGTDGALAALRSGDRARGVHHARRACRRCRDVMWLIRADLQASIGRPLDAAWRQAARRLGPLRDADVVPAAVGQVAGDLPGLVWALPPSPDDAEQRVAAALEDLARARAALDGLDLEALDRSTVVAAFRRSWRETRHAMAEAERARDVEIVHDWRKSVRRLSHHAQLLVPVWPAVGGALVDELDALQDVLGTHHDLALVARALDRDRTAPGAAAALDARLAERAETLVGEAFRRGRLALAARPRTLGDILGALWAAAAS